MDRERLVGNLDEYLTPERIDYLNNQIEYVNLFSRQNEPHSTAAIFRNKAK